MFPTWGNTCGNSWGNTWYCGEAVSRKSQLEAKLKFLRSTRDDLEIRLAATNAALEQIERQLSRENQAV